VAGRLDGKVAWISGGSSGIGLGAVELFVEEGCKVVVAARRAEGVQLESRFPGQVRYIRCDVLNEDEIAASILAAQTEFGGLDIIFNNAGTPGEGGTVEDVTVPGWDHAFAQLLRSQVLAIKHGVPLMRQRGGGSIINNASGCAVFNYGNSPDYGAAKGGVVQLTRHLAADLGPDRIRINCIIPGWTATTIVGVHYGASPAVAERMTHYYTEGYKKLQPIPVAGTPRHIAQAVLFLASDDAEWITGVTLPVDGGLLVKNQLDPQMGDIIADALARAKADLGED
jgi:NAD(P)-dependent dehydrogenase (short-subunit alcohol dehydrogenase family)